MSIWKSEKIAPKISTVRDWRNSASLLSEQRGRALTFCLEKGKVALRTMAFPNDRKRGLIILAIPCQQMATKMFVEIGKKIFGSVVINSQKLFVSKYLLHPILCPNTTYNPGEMGQQHRVQTNGPTLKAALIFCRCFLEKFLINVYTLVSSALCAQREKVVLNTLLRSQKNSQII